MDKIGLFFLQLFELFPELFEVVVRGSVIGRELRLLKNDPAKADLFKSRNSCMAESADMTQCIRLCLDASDICEATARLGARRTGDDQPILRELLELCARMCEQCAAECERHDHEHCKLCAQICRECAEDCSKAALSLT